jgi:ferredoxin--NADP+ reductase
MSATRIAIVGAGPAGAFTAAALLRSRGDAEIDLIERLPTPWGLLRGGVAPDHQEIKRLDERFHSETLARGCRFLGNVEVGVDVSHAELMRHFSAVIYATGAQTDKSLGIPGEDLPGSWAATEFVAWYNGHPDYRDLDFDMSAERAVVIGNGNVAADVTRMLTLAPGELERTDVADHALEALHNSAIREVIVLGRRGPAQAAFTSAELRELGRLPGVGLRVAGADVELDPVSSQWLAEEGTFTARTNVELLREYAAAPRIGERTIELRFLGSPVEIRGDGQVEGLDVRRNRIARAPDGRLAAEPVDGPLDTIECGLVLRSVGYRAVPLPDVPFDERHFVLPNERGRVLSTDGEPVRGVYAVGWIKRGPTGILGTNKRDAEETVACLAEDARAGALPAPAQPGREAFDALVAERVPRLVTADDWQSINLHELERGRASERPRVKLASRDELLAAASGR